MNTSTLATLESRSEPGLKLEHLQFEVFTLLISIIQNNYKDRKKYV